MINDKHCFEVYGYDVLIDEQLKPWLIEVNASPSLSSTTDMDRNLKMGIIGDAFQIVVPQDWMEEGKHGANTSKESQVGNYTLMIDEAGPEQPTGAKGGKGAVEKAVRRHGVSNNLWR